jgi:hypothetical protein
MVYYCRKKTSLFGRFIQNNLSSIEWGPKRECDQIGAYAHLRASPDYNDIAYYRQSSTLPEYTLNPHEHSNKFENIESYRF